MIIQDQKLANNLKRLYEDQTFSTTFQDEVYSWNSNEVDIIDWEIVYYLKLNQLLGEGTNAIASFDVIITDIIVDGDDMYHRWVEDGFDENTWYIIKVDEDLYDTIGKDFPISIYFNFLPEE
jgi:hypothetical protein